MKLKELADKKILILGLGREGQSTFLFLRKKFPKKVLGLADKLLFEKLPPKTQKQISKDKNINPHLGKGYLKALKDYDVISKSPGIPPRKIKPYLTKKQRITSQTEIFFDECRGKIIGVTGTKGKSTTATLIYKILKRGGLPVHLIGNIGRPALSYLEKAKKGNIFVYELSSHQLFSLKKSPQVAVFLNIYPEHLDYYRGLKEYFEAKQNIALLQKSKDYFIFNAGQKELIDLAKKTKARKIPFSQKCSTSGLTSGIVEHRRGCWIEKDYIVAAFKGKKEKIIKIKDIPLLGEFNLLNVMAAVLVGKIFGLTPKSIAKTIRAFKGLPHRLEFVGKIRGIKFYNDSLATIPEATIEALDTLGKDVQTVLLGGFDRGVSFKRLAQRIWRADIKTIILFPESGMRIWSEILKQRKEKEKLPSFFLAHDMAEAVKLAFEHTAKGKICLLSPAAPSFGLFKDYKERGELFKKYLKKTK